MVVSYTGKIISNRGVETAQGNKNSGVVCVWLREEGAGGVTLARYRQRPANSSPLVP